MSKSCHVFEKILNTSFKISILLALTVSFSKFLFLNKLTIQF